MVLRVSHWYASTMPELRRAVLFLGEARLEVLLKDKDGSGNDVARTVTVSWMKKERQDNPPPDWSEQAKWECDYQRGLEWELATGRAKL